MPKDSIHTLKIPIRIFLSYNTKGKTLTLQQNKSHIKLRGEGTRYISYDLELNFENDCKIFDVEGFIAGLFQEIKIISIKFNDRFFDSKNGLHRLLSFKMKNNPYVENEILINQTFIGFNGELYLNLIREKDLLQWRSTSYSKKKNDLIIDNPMFLCPNETGCYIGRKICSSCEIPLRQYKIDRGKKYNIVGLGCSISAGTAIKKSQTWLNLLQKNNEENLNLSFPGAGIDLIYNNFNYLVNSAISFKKLVVLFPNFERLLHREYKDGLYFPFMTLIRTKEEQFTEEIKDSIFFKREELSSIFLKAHRKLINNGNEKRSRLILKRMLNSMECKKINYFVSSWCPATYDLLRKIVFDKKKLLPIFPKNDRKAEDKRHPSEKIHRQWIGAIERIVDGR